MLKLQIYSTNKFIQVEEIAFRTEASVLLFLISSIINVLGLLFEIGLRRYRATRKPATTRSLIAIVHRCVCSLGRLLRVLSGTCCNPIGALNSPQIPSELQNF